MDDIQFVLEAPHLTQGHKKRPRLVTSCDNWYVPPLIDGQREAKICCSRLKKVKCIQTTPNTQCEACTLAHVPCRFRDREKYFAERRRIMSGAGSSEGSRRQSSSTPEAQLDTWIPPSSVGCAAITSSSIPHYGRSSPATSYYDNDAVSRTSYSTTPPQHHHRVGRGSPVYAENMSVPVVPSQHWYVLSRLPGPLTVSSPVSLC